jgi:hypothetical protein
MNQKATKKLTAGDRFGLHGAGFAILVTKRHLRFRHLNDSLTGHYIVNRFFL